MPFFHYSISGICALGNNVVIFLTRVGSRHAKLFTAVTAPGKHTSGNDKLSRSVKDIQE